MTDAKNTVQYYLEQLMFGMGLKSAISAMLLFFTEFLYGNTVVLSIYFVMVSIDLMLGIARACLYGVFQYKILLHWMFKIVTHILLIVVLGLLCNSMYHTTGLTFSVVNWLLFCCTITETVSIIYNLKRLGCPVPFFVDKVMVLLRKRAAKHIAAAMDAPDLRQDIEDLLSNKGVADESPDRASGGRSDNDTMDGVSGDNETAQSQRGVDNQVERGQ